VACDLDSKLPFQSDFFDLAVSFFVIEHLSDLENFFMETYRILKP
jgi:ubiquinone/menaquinone biosynthesis C-methylase UbiE